LLLSHDRVPADEIHMGAAEYDTRLIAVPSIAREQLLIAREILKELNALIELDNETRVPRTQHLPHESFRLLLFYAQHALLARTGIKHDSQSHRRVGFAREKVHLLMRASSVTMKFS
jgi:hypothetical protein